MKCFRITARCDNGHTQALHLHYPARVYAEQFAGLMDGTSPLYKFPPGPDSVLGKCGMCQASFRCQVEEVPASSPLEEGGRHEAQEG